MPHPTFNPQRGGSEAAPTAEGKPVIIGRPLGANDMEGVPFLGGHPPVQGL